MENQEQAENQEKLQGPDISTWTEEELKEAVRGISDPELGISIVDLGLIYEIKKEEGGKLRVHMTLTGPGCPVGPLLQAQVHGTLMKLPGVREVQVEIVWTPPWDPYTMASEDAKLQLGIF